MVLRAITMSSQLNAGFFMRPVVDGRVVHGEVL
jgi:hypothetical protein